MEFYSAETHRKLTMCLRTGEFDLAQEIIKEVYDECYKKATALEHVYTITLGLQTICLSYIMEMNAVINVVLGEACKPILKAIDGMSLDEARASTLETYKKVIDYFSKIYSSNAKKVAIRTKEYIDKSYENNCLSLGMIAKELQIGADYIRHSFKQEYSLTITDYVLELRMKKARELMTLGEIRMSEVGKKIGITDPHYFSKCFKKYYGIAPSKFKNFERG